MASTLPPPRSTAGSLFDSDDWHPSSAAQGLGFVVLGLSTLIGCGSFSLRPAGSTTLCLRPGLTTSARMPSYAMNSLIRRVGLPPTLMLASPAHGLKARHVIARAGAKRRPRLPAPKNTPSPVRAPLLCPISDPPLRSP